MIIILAGAIISMAWGLWRVLTKSSSQAQQSMGLAAILIGAAVAITANFTSLGSGAMTAVALLAASGMLVLAIFGIRAVRRPEGGATGLDLAAIIIALFSFLVGSIFHG